MFAELLGLSSSEVSSFFIQAYGWILTIAIILGLLSGYLKCQYGKVVSHYSEILKNVVMVVVVLLALIDDWHQLSQLMSFYLGKYVVEYYYFFVHANKYTGPNNRHLEKGEIQLDTSILEFQLPAENSSPRFYDHVDDDFEKQGDYGPESKCCFNRNFAFYNGRGKEGAYLKLTVSLQKMPEFVSLETVENLNAAAAWYYLVSHSIPDKVTELSQDSYEKSDNTMILNWEAKSAGLVNYVAFSQENRDIENHSIRFIHVAVNSTLMLTIRIQVDVYKTEAKKQVVAFLNKLESAWTLVGKGPENSEEFKAAKTLPGLLPPEHKVFTLQLPSEKEYRLAVREHSSDPLEWMVFEQSFGFYDWFVIQQSIVCNEYNSLLDEFVQERRDACLTTAKFFSAGGNKIEDISEKVTEASV